MNFRNLVAKNFRSFKAPGFLNLPRLKAAAATSSSRVGIELGVRLLVIWNGGRDHNVQDSLLHTDMPQQRMFRPISTIDNQQEGPSFTDV